MASIFGVVMRILYLKEGPGFRVEIAFSLRQRFTRPDAFGQARALEAMRGAESREDEGDAESNVDARFSVHLGWASEVGV